MRVPVHMSAQGALHWLAGSACSSVDRTGTLALLEALRGHGGNVLAVSGLEVLDGAGFHTQRAAVLAGYTLTAPAGLSSSTRTLDVLAASPLAAAMVVMNMSAIGVMLEPYVGASSADDECLDGEASVCRFEGREHRMDLWSLGAVLRSSRILDALLEGLRPESSWQDQRHRKRVTAALARALEVHDEEANIPLELVRPGVVDVVRTLLVQGADLALGDVPGSAAQAGWITLVAATIEGAAAVAPVQRLAAAGFPMVHEASRDRSALHVACRMENPLLVACLLDCGASLSEIDANGVTVEDLTASRYPMMREVIQSWRLRKAARGVMDSFGPGHPTSACEP